MTHYEDKPISAGQGRTAAMAKIIRKKNKTKHCVGKYNNLLISRQAIHRSTHPVATVCYEEARQTTSTF